jgi:hypothetical protein
MHVGFRRIPGVQNKRARLAFSIVAMASPLNSKEKGKSNDQASGCLPAGDGIDGRNEAFLLIARVLLNSSSTLSSISLTDTSRSTGKSVMSCHELLEPASPPQSGRSAPVSTSRQACERCRFHKLRCTRKSTDTTSDACIRCSRARAICTTKNRGPIGRPRGGSRTQALVAGTVQHQAEKDRQRLHELNFSPTRTPAPSTSSNNSPRCTQAFSSDQIWVSGSPAATSAYHTLTGTDGEKNAETPSSVLEPEFPWQVVETRDPGTAGVEDVTSGLGRANPGAESSSSCPGIDALHYSQANEGEGIRSKPGNAHNSEIPQYAIDQPVLDQLDDSPAMLGINTPSLSPFGSPEPLIDPYFQLSQLNQKLYKQFIHIEANSGSSIFPEGDGAYKSTGEAEVGEILRTSQEFASILAQIVQSLHMADNPHPFAETEVLDLTCAAPESVHATGRRSQSFSTAAALSDFPESSPILSDTTMILLISGCYLYLVRIHTFLFSRLLHLIHSAKSFSLQFSTPIAPESTIPGLQIGGFPVNNGNLQVLILLNVVMHILNEIEGHLGLPAEISVCGACALRPQRILGDSSESLGITDLFIASLRQEERIRRKRSSGGVGRLRELVKSVKSELGSVSNM